MKTYIHLIMLSVAFLLLVVTTLLTNPVVCAISGWLWAITVTVLMLKFKKRHDKQAAEFIAKFIMDGAGTPCGHKRRGRKPKVEKE